ncbi:hypothetical protein ACP70R_036017 [Stipagrostis hirtigluma subsp. patula]
MARLTVEQAAREAGSARSNATDLKLSHRALSDVSCLSSFRNLEHLDLSYNCLVTLEGLSSCVNLKLLSVVENKLVSLKGVEGLSKLQVLNAGKNKLTRMDEVTSLTSLGALILNDNNISSICKLDRLQQLNTLVLSKNPVVTIGDALAKAKSMKKLSLSHCLIEDIGSSVAACVELKELRLAHNKITKIPADLAKNVKILNLDLGNNLIERSSDLKGNPISEKDDVAKKVKKLVPTLRILNAKPLEASSRSDKSSRKENLANKDKDMYDHDPIEIGTKKKDKKRKQTKQQLKAPEESAEQTISRSVITSVPSKSEVLPGKERKKEKLAMEHANNSKLKRKDDKSSADDTGRKDKEEAKRKKFVDEEDIEAEGIDNTEVSFADLVFSKEYSQEPMPEDKTQGAAADGKFAAGLVIDHTKKRKKSKGVVTITDSATLKQLSSVPDVGTGGLGMSGWD